MVSESLAGPGISSSRQEELFKKKKIPNQHEETSACREDRRENMYLKCYSLTAVDKQIKLLGETLTNCVFSDIGSGCVWLLRELCQCMLVLLHQK